MVRLNCVLAKLGIFGVRSSPGLYRAPCPDCARVKPRRNDRALAVTVEADGGVVWFCHRCHWTGGTRARRQDRDREPLLAAKGADAADGLSDYGQWLWRECQAITPSSPAGRYLASRRCVVPNGDLRWHPALKHAASGLRFPALLGLVTDVRTHRPISMHRTYLARDGSGKAPVEASRLLLKGHSKRGGVIRLSSDAEVTDGLTVGEGIETGLSALAAGHGPVWACIDAGNLSAFPLLSGIESLTVLVDYDEAGRAAFRAVAQRWLEADREVRQFLAAEGDANDWWRRAG